MSDCPQVPSISRVRAMVAEALDFNIALDSIEKTEKL